MKKEFNRLSDRQRNILRFMQNYMLQAGYPPTIREIGEATGINSTSVVNYNLNKLVAAGYLERSDRVSRGLRLVGAVPGTKAKRVKASVSGPRVPLIGHIVASRPAEMPEDSGQHFDEEDLIDVPEALLSGTDPANAFAMMVKGDSMIDAMIQEGDIVVLRSQSTADNGDMVVVWLPERSETTMKYFYLEGDKVRLQPAHPTMQPIIVPADECEIRGKVLSVMRSVRRIH